MEAWWTRRREVGSQRMMWTPVWRLGLSYAARERGLNAPLACRDSRNRFVTASDVVLFLQNLSDDTGLSAGCGTAQKRLLRNCLIWLQASSYARSSGLERFGYAVHPSLATGAILCRPLARAECRQTSRMPKLTDILRRPRARAESPSRLPKLTEQLCNSL